MGSCSVISAESKHADSRSFLLVCAGLVLLVAVVYWRVSGFPFMGIDDIVYVVENPNIREGLTTRTFLWAFAPTYQVANWHPLTWLSLLLDYQISGLDPGAFHFTNLVLHAAAVLLLFVALHKMTGFVWRSAFVAALFAIHPVRVESVAWISERKDCLSAPFWMLTILLYVRFARKPTRGSYALVLVVFALGLMAKQMLVTLPLVLLMLDYWPLGRIAPTNENATSAKTLRRLVIEKVPMLVMSVAAGVMAVWAQTVGGSIRGIQEYPLGVRAANAPVSYLVHLGKAVWPKDLAVFYPHPGTTLPVWQVVGSAVALVCITALAVAVRKKRPYVLVGWLWYLVTLFPMIGMMQSGTQALCDHHTYIPVIGVFIAIAWVVPEVFARGSVAAHAAVSAAAVIIVAALAVAAYVQVGYWRDDVTLFSRAIKAVSRNYYAEDALGVALDRLGRTDEAIRHYNEALRIRPEYFNAHYNLASLLTKQGKSDEALPHLQAAVRIEPRDSKARTDLGKLLIEKGRLPEAERQLRIAIRLQPTNHLAHNNLGAVFMRQGRVEEGIRHFERAVELDPGNPSYWTNLENARAYQ